MKKISCVIFSVMLVVFSLMPVTAFARTGINSVNYRQIAKDNGIEISEDYSNYFVYSKDVSEPDFCYCVFSQYPVTVTTDNLLFSDKEQNNIIIVKYGLDNVYSNVSLGVKGTLNKLVKNPATQEGGNMNSYDFTQYCYSKNHKANVNNFGIKGYYSNFKVMKDGEVFFTPTSTTSTPGGATQQEVLLGATLKKTTLSEVLSELVALLPILLPVLITFIAIRKGIKFILSQLRAA